MRIRKLAISAIGIFAGIAGGLATGGADEQMRAEGTTAGSKSVFTTADIIVEYRDASGKEIKHWQKFRVEDAEAVARLAAHFPGILDDRGAGPRTHGTWKSKFTILFHPQNDDKGRMRVAHVGPDYSLWWWRDNPPFTGDRRVEGKDKLRELIEELAAKHRVDLK